jgi:predicted SprT family Zn-dependent metalloprotease
MTNSFGNASYRTNTIQVSPVLCEINKIKWDSKELEEVIVHEFTHLYLKWTLGRCVGHGKEFQNKMKACFPEGSLNAGNSYTYHTMKTEKKKDKWLATCPACGKQVTYKRKTNTACGTCCRKHNNGLYDKRFAFTFTEINK